MNYEQMNDEELLKAYDRALKVYESWRTSTDGSAGACWEYEVMPVRRELVKRRLLKCDS